MDYGQVSWKEWLEVQLLMGVCWFMSGTEQRRKSSPPTFDCSIPSRPEPV